MRLGQAINCDAQLSQLVGGDGHTRADEFNGSVTVNSLDGIVGGQQILEDGKEHNDQQGTEENIHGALALGSNLLVKGSGTAAIDVLALGGIGNLLLELGILVKILTALVGSDRGCENTQQTGGDGHHEHLRNGNGVTVSTRDGDKGHYRCGNR